ncbi:disease resistance protein [Tanacetum coccineum]
MPTSSFKKREIHYCSYPRGWVDLGLENDLLALNNTFKQIKGVLHDAEKKKTTQNTMEEWLKTLKSASLEVENVLDEAKTKAMIQSLPNIKHKARTFFSSHHNPLLVKTRIVHKVKNIRKKLEVIDANRSRFHLTPNIVSEVDAGIVGEISNRKTSSLISKINGRDKEKKMIVYKIYNQDIGIEHDDDDVRVYAIWGMGGIGKTTLAQYAYNHETVKTHFELKCCVYVSAMFDIKRIIKQIIKVIYGLEDMKLEAKIKIQNKLDAMSFDDLQTQLQNKLDAMSLDDLQTQLQNKLDAMSLDDLQKQCQNKLKGKKYFIIMDDVWIENKNMEKSIIRKGVMVAIRDACVPRQRRRGNRKGDYREGDSEEMQRETSSLVNLSKIYGRDEEKKMIVDTICNQDIGIPHDDDDVRVYAIWGMGGIGKTTLAQYAYNHETVKTHFELKCWVYVSVVFDVTRIIKQIIKAICGPEDLKLKLDEMSLDGLQKHLESKLRGKKYFIIMDDIWIENNEMEKWDELCKALSCGAKGSTVMVTTRKKDTAQLMAKIPELQRNVEKLSKEESWSLFEKLAFPGRLEGENVSSELELVGKEIVEKCNGLPLAVKTMGSLMSTKKSYDDLPPHMKICFAYCCVFSKGEEMSKDSLIDLWMANRFIPSQGDVSLYVLGEEIFSCLVRRSFFQDVVEKDIYTGEICKMHDLMHDLAQYEMRHDCAVIGPGKVLITPNEVLHLSIKCEDFEFSKQDLKKLRSVRSMVKNRSSTIVDYKSPKLAGFNSRKVSLVIGVAKRLSQFAVGKDDGARIGELGNLNLLGWRLKLSRLINVGGLRDAKSANLKDKTNLKSLELQWSLFRSKETCCSEEEVVEGLEPNLGLQELTIDGYMGRVISPSWLVKLVNLTSILFYHLSKCEQLPPLGKLPSLKSFRLYKMKSLKCFHYDDDTASKDHVGFRSTNNPGY